MALAFLTSQLKIVFMSEFFLFSRIIGAAEKVQTTTEASVFKTKSCFEKPYRCPHPKIEFYLYTRRTQKKPEKLDVLDPEAFYYTHFNRAHPTKIIIHGNSFIFNICTKYFL